MGTLFDTAKLRGHTYHRKSKNILVKKNLDTPKRKLSLNYVDSEQASTKRSC